MSPIPLTDQLASLTRKLRIRLRVYPHLVRRGTMTQAKMDHKVACMRAVLDTLTRLDTQLSPLSGGAAMIPITYEYGPTSVSASVPDLPGCVAVGRTYEHVRRMIAEAIALHLEEMQADAGLRPSVLDLCPCADCDAPVLWTRVGDVRTAWSVHQCPLERGDTP